MKIITPQEYHLYETIANYQKIIPIIQKCLIPIFKQSVDGYYFHVEGTAIYIEYQNKKYLATASHIFQRDEYGKLKYHYYLPGTLTLAMLEGKYGVMNSKTDQDDIDTIVYCLDNNSINQLSQYEPLLINSFDGNRIINPNSDLCFCGFPKSKNDRYHDKVDKLITYAMINMSAENEVYLKENCDSNYNIILHYNNSKCFDFKGNRIKFPMPYGMSGGAIWKLRDKSNFSSEQDIYLAGMVLRKNKSEEFVIGVKLNLIIKCINNLPKTI